LSTQKHKVLLLTKRNQKYIKQLEAGMTDTIELTKRLVRIKSCNPGECEGEIGDFIFARLKERGLTVRKQEVHSGRSNIIAVIKGETDLPPLVMPHGYRCNR